MIAFILAAGRGTRLTTFTQNMPKVMLSVCGKPLLQRQIENCRGLGIKRIFINLFWQGEVIQKYFGNGQKYGVSIKYFPEKTLLGTGGALKQAEKFIDETMLILYGDVAFDMELEKLINFHRQKKALLTLTVHETDHPQDSDLIEADKSGKVIRIWRKPHQIRKKLLANAGIMICEPQMIRQMKQRTVSIEDTLFPMASKMNKLFAYETKEYIKDIGTPIRLRVVREYFKNKNV